jgi:predicted lipid-binding transport protein (Tim44 family)
MPGDERRQWARGIRSLWLYLARWTLGGLVPGWSVMPIAFTLPAVEIIAALRLILDLRGSLAVTTGLLMRLQRSSVGSKNCSARAAQKL